MISIIMGVYNDEEYVMQAVQSILDQTYKNFEFIIINDGSTDDSPKILSSFKDKRIKLINNRKSTGFSKFRNQGLKVAKGKYVFFTDSDVFVDKNWLKEGLNAFKKHNCLGVEGLTYYIRKGYKPSISDRLPGTVEKPEHYMTCNMAYTRAILSKVGGVNIKFEYHNDRELGLRVSKLGKIVYCPKMIVVHQKKLWTVKSSIASAKRVISRVLMYKAGLDDSFIRFRIMYPENLLKILFPPLVLLQLLNHKNNTWLDFKLALASYPKFVYQRILIWKTAWEERVFLI